MGLLGSLLAAWHLAQRLLALALFFEPLAVWPLGMGLLGAPGAAWLLALATASLLPACGGDSTPSNQPGQRIAVVTTSNIVADWVSRVGGDSLDVFSLLSIASDPHTFSPGARDITRVTRADLIVTVGLGMEAVVQACTNLKRGWYEVMGDLPVANPPGAHGGQKAHQHG